MWSVFINNMNISFYLPLNNASSIEHHPDTSDTENESRSPIVSSVLSDGFLEVNEIQSDSDRNKSTYRFDKFHQFNSQTGAGQIQSTPKPITEASITTETVDLPSIHFPFTTMSKLFKCRDFSGYPQDNAKGFLSAFEPYALLHDLESDKRRIAAFHLHLKGSALTWINSLRIEELVVNNMRFVQRKVR